MATYVKIMNFTDFSWPNPNRLRFNRDIDVHVAWNVVVLFGQGGAQTIMHRLEKLASSIPPIATEVERMKLGMFKINPADVAEVNLRCERMGPQNDTGMLNMDNVKLTLKLGETVSLKPFPYNNPGVVVQMMLTH